MIWWNRLVLVMNGASNTPQSWRSESSVILSDALHRKSCANTGTAVAVAAVEEAQASILRHYTRIFSEIRIPPLAPSRGEGEIAVFREAIPRITVTAGGMRDRVVDETSADTTVQHVVDPLVLPYKGRAQADILVSRINSRTENQPVIVPVDSIFAVTDGSMLFVRLTTMSFGEFQSKVAMAGCQRVIQSIAMAGRRIWFNEDCSAAGNSPVARKLSRLIAGYDRAFGKPLKVDTVLACSQSDATKRLQIRSAVKAGIVQVPGVPELADARQHTPGRIKVTGRTEVQYSPVAFEVQRIVNA